MTARTMPGLSGQARVRTNSVVRVLGDEGSSGLGRCGWNAAGGAAIKNCGHDFLLLRGDYVGRGAGFGALSVASPGHRVAVEQRPSQSCLVTRSNCTPPCCSTPVRMARSTTDVASRLSQGQRIAAQVRGQCDAQQQHDQDERQGGHDRDALQAGQRLGRFVAAGQEHDRCHSAGQQAPEDHQSAAGFARLRWS